jgi:hypothetical protein
MDVILSWLYSDEAGKLPRFGLKETIPDVLRVETTETGDVMLMLEDGRRMWCSRAILGKAEQTP